MEWVGLTHFSLKPWPPPPLAPECWVSGRLRFTRTVEALTCVVRLLNCHLIGEKKYSV